MRWILSHKLLVVGIILIAAIVAAALRPQSIEIDLARAERGPLEVTIQEEGETRVRERYTVSAPVAARLSRIQLEPGDPVVRDQTVVAELSPVTSPLLDPRTRAELTVALGAAQAAVGEARAERARLEAEVARARATLSRSEQLLKSGTISSDQFENDQTARRTAEEALRAAEFTVQRSVAELELARARLGAPGSTGRLLTLLAPADGVVLRRFHESEGVVAAGEPLLEIGDPGQTEIVADLLSTDAVRVPPGARVSIEDWGGDRALEARVRRVEPAGFMKVSALGVEEQRVNVIIDWTDPGARELGDGYRVEVRIVLWEAPEVLRAPNASLFRRNEDWAVFTVEDERAHLKTVKLGRRNQNDAQILEGLTPGQAIVLHPPDTLRDGVRVRARQR